MKSTIIALIVVVLGLTGSVGYYFWHLHKSSKVSAVTVTDTSDNSPSTINSNQPASALTTQGQASGTLGASTDSSNSPVLQTNLGQQSASSGSSAPTIPGPESFGQYDKYKDGQSALFGDLQVGTGAEVTATSTVAVVYKGWLTNGQLFDASKTDPKTGKIQAFQFTMGGHQVIVGWEEGLLGMKVGGTRRLIVPPAVGYGATGQGPIPPNSLMVFDVQLVQVK